MSKVIHLLHVNDVHSHFERMPQIAAQIRKLKHEWLEQGESVLVLDIGDHTDRVHPVTEGTEGLANIEILNTLGIDMMTIGNNEGLTFDARQLENMFAHAKFDIVITNMVDLETRQVPAWAKPFIIREIEGIRFGFLGVTAAFNMFYELLGWHILDPIETVEKWVNQYRDEVDQWVILSHIGIHLDPKLAKVLPPGSIILGAHTHNVLPQGERFGEVLLAEAGKFGDYVGHVRLVYDKKTNQLLSAEAELYSMDLPPADEETVKVIEEQQEQAMSTLAQGVAEIQEDLNISWYQESDLGNLLAEALRVHTGAQIGLVNSGQILEGVKKGTLSRGQLHALCPSPNNPCRAMVQGEVLLTTLEQSLQSEFQERVFRGFGFRGKVIGNLSTAGLRIHFNPHATDSPRILEVWVGDEPIQPDKWYTVGMIDMFTFGIGYPGLRKAEEVRYYKPEFLRDILGEALNWPHASELAKRRNWVVV